MKQGDVFIIPTDTVFGLACMLYDETALEKIYAIKGRDQSKQIPILVSGVEDLTLIADCDQACRLLTKAFWPGALSIVLKTTAAHRKKTNEETVAVRMPENKLVLDLIKRYGPFRATSLNKSGEPPLSDWHQINQTYGHVVDTIYGDQETTFSNQASTVVLIDNHNMRILRQGSITEDMIKDVLEG
jgi:L-threonylcarbamoyladenylate synthase